MKHTTGPWKVQVFDALDGYEVVAESWDVVSASLRPAAPIRKLSDARLIAAAPDLLEALQAICNDGIHCAIAPYLEERTRAAIAKATEGEG